MTLQLLAAAMKYLLGDIYTWAYLYPRVPPSSNYNTHDKDRTKKPKGP